MNNSRIFILLLSISLLISLSACDLGDPQQPGLPLDPPSTESILITTPEPQAASEHRILVDGEGFIDTVTGEPFILRGVNHIEISAYGDCALAVNQYDPVRTDAMFAQLAGFGYNTVRMFLDICTDPVNGLGAGSGGLNPAVLDNIVHLMSSAKEHGIYLLLTSNDLPTNGDYWAINDEGFVEGTFGPYRNTQYLTESGVRSARVYWDDLMSGLAERAAPFDAVLAWQLLNEQWYFNNEPPFSLSEGMVTTANGLTYDMSDIDQKREMANDSLIYWIEQVSQVIHTYDPTSPITMGFFDTGDTLLNPDWDFRYNDVRAMIDLAPLDFIDFHAYPGGGYHIDRPAEYLGLDEYHTKPVILGEFGAFRQSFSEIETGAHISAAWMEDSCKNGFDGWLYWVYGVTNTGAPDDPWSFIEADGLIMEILAPVNSPDPCDINFDITGSINLAYNASVTASVEEQADDGEFYPPNNAVDYSLTTWWSAGAGAVQWIEIDLGQSSLIERFKLVDLYGGQGRHVNKLWGKGDVPGSDYILIATLDVNSEQEELVIEYVLPEPIAGIQFIKVETVASPGWIIWHEIEVYGSPAD